ncbi:MAG: hypothetical protein HUK17_04455 [Bacteroidales bacterium]|nr:hypothetical protein [Bacteroidales bacterium]
MKKALLLSLLLLPAWLGAQVINKVDPLECHIVGVNVSGIVPSSLVAQQGNMRDLYKPPYLGFGVEGLYKYKNNFMLTLEGNITMGSDNLTLRTDRMPDVFTRDSIIIGMGGYDAMVTCYNRGLDLKVGLGYIFKLNDKNPNSGVLARVSGGWMTNKTVFMLNDAKAPQVEQPYDALYDHRRSGWMLTEGIGYQFMSNHKTLVNIYAIFEVSQCWSHSTRNYVIDEVMGLHGPDNNKYFDLLYSLKICWMIPLTGRPAYDYYF